MKTKTEIWDQFEPFEKLEKKGFLFEPSNFEIWSNGNLIESGKCYHSIEARVVLNNGMEKVVVFISETSLKEQILDEVLFDEFYTFSDRLRLVTLPAETFTENFGLVSLRALHGSTRTLKNFFSTEPYCCNLFLVEGKISKITFAFCLPEKLIEFYS
jgi:hypothetical protein